MLEPDSRVVLLDQLRPPAGYRLHAAVATTFTLSMTTALIPPLAFAAFDVSTLADPIAALEAVRSCTDRVDVFCQAGQIAVPRSHSPLMAYLEPMIHPVRRPKPGSLFHPKVWFLHYRAEDLPDQFRLLCSTRNLTDSQAWDAVVTIDGTAEGADRPGNAPLAALIRRLPQLAVRGLTASRRARIESLAAAASQVVWNAPEDVREVAFHAFGVPGIISAPDFGGYRHLVISPFCNVEGIAEITRSSRGDVTIVSRLETLDEVGPEALSSFGNYILNPLASLDTEASEVPVPALNGLHAKIIVVERDRSAHVFVGSPNATGAAFGGNVEFAVELTGGASRLGVETFIGPDAPFRKLIETYTPGEIAKPDSTDELMRSLMATLRELAELRLTMTVEGPDAVGRYGLRLTSDDRLKLRSGFGLKAELLTVAGHAGDLAGGVPVDYVFTKVALAEISPFVVLYLTDLEHSTTTRPLQVSTVVHAGLVNDPEGRFDEILAAQFDNPGMLFRFLALLLGLGNGTAPQLGNGSSEGAGSRGDQPGAGLFEVVVNALATNPQALHDLDRLVASLQRTEKGRLVITSEFARLWDPVREALGVVEANP